MFAIQSLLLAGACLVTSASAATIDTQLVGTWSTKSAKVMTGPAFYNPLNDSFIEPSHTGISYSFTADGFYESAYYRAVSDPSKPECAKGIMQFQYGTVIMNSDLSLTLNPFASDGRQLMSDPCVSTSHATYTRYNQSETMAKWQVYTDPYTKLLRLDLYQFNGVAMNPMFLAYRPPQMLPTSAFPQATSTAAAKAKRTAGPEDEDTLPLNRDAKHVHQRSNIEERSLVHRVDLNIIWWTGIGMVIFGGTAYML